MPGRHVLVLLILLAVCPHLLFAQSSIECPTEINGALRGGPGNIQDHMFHSIAIDPANENVVYAGTETNGIFKTTDGGASWTRLRLGFKCGTQQSGYPQIFDIAVDPSNPQVIYTATINGPGPSDNPIHPAATAGIYKSTDGGLTWTQKIQGFTTTYASYVIVDSTNSNRVYAGLGGAKSTFAAPFPFYEGGIWVSNDAGESWAPLPVSAVLKTNILVDMVVRGANQRTIYASGTIHGADAPVAEGFVRSVDGGQTWTTSNPSGGKILGFDAYPQDPSIIYGHDDSTGRKVHKSTDGGLTWTQLQAGFFGVVRIHPRDPLTVWYTGRTSIIKSRDGFLTSRETYNDTTLTEAQQMVDIKVSVSNPNVVWAAAKGYYLYKSTDGGETFTKTTAVRDLVYGNAVSYYASAVSNNALSQTGLAIVNSGTASASITLTAIKDDGTLLAGTGIQNPVNVTLPGKGQFSGVTSQVFGGTVENTFWTKIGADKPGTTGFFLSFDPALSTMDGANFSHRLLTDFILPEIRNVDVILVNPHNTTEELTLTWYTNDGIVQDARVLPIGANGRFSGIPGWLFPSYSGADGYIRAASRRGIIASERSSTSAASTFVSGLHADTGSRFLYSPQFVFGGGFKSTLTLISLESGSSTVSLTWTDKNGSRIGQQVSVTIPGRGRTVISDATIFGVAQPQALTEGHLGIRGGGPRLTGTVTFGDAADAQFRTSLPLLSEPAKDVIYGHVAQDATFYTGIAIVNMNSQPANVTVSIFNKDGVQIGSGARTIAAFARISEVLSQIDSRLPPQSSGYFRVVSDKQVFSFALFGTHTSTALAAIPGQVLP